MTVQVTRLEALPNRAKCHYAKKLVLLILNGVEESDQRLKAQA